MSWVTIKKEYIQGDIGYRPLAEKHKVSFNTLKGRASRENWYEEREKYRLSVGKEAAQRAGEKAGEKKTPRGKGKATGEKQERKRGKQVRKAKDVFAAADLLLEAVCTMADTPQTAGEIRALTAALKDIKEIQMIRDAVSGSEMKINMRMEEDANAGDKPDSEPEADEVL